MITSFNPNTRTNLIFPLKKGLNINTCKLECTMKDRIHEIEQRCKNLARHDFPIGSTNVNSCI